MVITYKLFVIINEHIILQVHVLKDVFFCTFELEIEFTSNLFYF